MGNTCFSLRRGEKLTRNPLCHCPARVLGMRRDEARQAIQGKTIKGLRTRTRA